VADLVTAIAVLMDILTLLLNTILLRPYVFIFLAAFLFSARLLLGWRRTIFHDQLDHGVSL
jgi:hypothetical protein